MGRIKKKGTSGAAKNFITRTQAVRKLQISLPDFRRLCIFKGIYPREPRNKKKAAKNSTPSTTFYYVRDIQYLLHEPLLAKFREHKALAKKIGRALGRGEVGDAARLEKTQTPRITLDHIIKERYPTFIDALRDLDDALSMLYLFANLPSSINMPPATITLCQRLCHEFEHYLITTHSLRKSFLSIKGIYYQATIQGQDILWLVPYKFVQRITNDIDLRIMGTFVEFYTTLMGFVNFRLYTTVGLVYPPKFDAASADKGGELGAFQLQERAIGSPQKQIENEQPNGAAESVSSSEATARAEAAVNALTDSKAITRVSSTEEDEDDLAVEPTAAVFDTFTPTDASADTLPQPDSTSTVAPQLFAPYTFYLSRETPRAPLEFLLRSFGCTRVGWPAVLGDGAFTNDESDSRITHQIVDRPPMPVSVGEDVGHAQEIDDSISGATARVNAPASFAAGGRMPGRTYIQPQWVWDCINEVRLLRPDLYAPGATLPPHLSPWVKPRAGEYDPRQPLELDDEEKAEAERDIDAAADKLEEEDEDSKSDGDEEVDEGVESVKGIADLQGDDGEDNGWGGFSGAEESDSETENVGAPTSSKTAPKSILKKTNGVTSKGPELAKKKAEAKRKRDEAEEKENRKMMMPRRKRKLYEKMEYSNARKDETTEKLTAKRRRVEREGKAGVR